MEDNSSGMKNTTKPSVEEDDSGLELCLGLSLGSKKSAQTSAAAAAAAASSEHEDVRPQSQGFWLEAPTKKKAAGLEGGAVLQLQQAATVNQQATTVNQGLHWDVNVAQRLRQVMQEKGGYHFGEDASVQQIAAAWGQFTKQIAAAPRGMDLAKHLSSKQQQHGGEQIQDDDVAVEPSSLEQHKRFNLQQEARKKRKMVIDEKQQKKIDGQDGSENPHLHRAASLGNIPNLVRSTSNLGSGVPKAQEDVVEQGGTTDDAKPLLGSWQLGTTKDIPSAENINPELRPGMVSGQLGGTGSSPDLPWVSATGPGPNGKTVTGVVYKLYQGQFKVVCACHGLHMSPAEFVRHAGQDATSTDNVKVLGGPETMTMLSQVTSA